MGPGSQPIRTPPTTPKAIGPKGFWRRFSAQQMIIPEQRSFSAAVYAKSALAALPLPPPAQPMQTMQATAPLARRTSNDPPVQMRPQPPPPPCRSCGHPDMRSETVRLCSFQTPTMNSICNGRTPRWVACDFTMGSKPMMRESNCRGTRPNTLTDLSLYSKWVCSTHPRISSSELVSRVRSPLRTTPLQMLNTRRTAEAKNKVILCTNLLS